jgi:hypothetical protein
MVLHGFFKSQQANEIVQRTFYCFAELQIIWSSFHKGLQANQMRFSSIFIASQTDGLELVSKGLQANQMV